VRQNYVTFKVTHMIAIATNHRPTVGTTEYSAWRRLRLIPFPYIYKPASKAGPGDRIENRGLRRRVATGRHQREALLAWIIAGATRWSTDGLPDCATVDQATGDWRLAEDRILHFITDELELLPDAVTPGNELYTAYRNHAEHLGHAAKSNQNFAKDFLAHDTIKTAGITKNRTAQGITYKGVSIRARSDDGLF
jgi:phage/plasmid-associated DNA primase